MAKIKNPYKSNKTYEVVSFKNHEAWKKDRDRGIGGSDVACIVGQNPYKQAYQLWQEKKGLIEPKDISEKSYVKYGTLAEEPLRELFKLDFEDRYEVFYEPDVVFISKEYPFMRYSPDGILYDKKTGEWGIFECKTTNIVQSSQREKWEKDNIPNNYYCQILHGLNVTGFKFVVLKAQLKFENPSGFCNLSTRHYFWNVDGNVQVEEDMDYLKNEVIVWWNKYFIGNQEPPLELTL